MIGTRLAQYEITAHLGSGGMGEVYQARDSKLGRAVAVKLLPEAFARDPDRVARLEREARLLASLNHPNIAGIYGFEQSDRGSFVVMELVEGETLAQRIARGPFPVDEALQIARQICEALEAAHDKGIVHRDLKPANIKINPGNQVKVLDFGLAKAIEAQSSNASMSNSPTLSMAATNAGVILGTAAYMSPEQAKGRAVDGRTDIFAFGCVLYEMLTGKPAFDGEDVTDILASILTREPDWARLPASVTARVRELLRLSLQKDIKNRRRHAGDLIIDIDQITTESSGGPAITAQRSSGNPRLAWFAAAGFAVVALVAIGWSSLRSVPAAPEMRLDIMTPSISEPPQFALSPDGQALVFVGALNGPARLWIRRLDTSEARPLNGTEGASFPFWSADGRSIGFSASNKLWRMDLDGGAPRAIAEAAQHTGATWNKDGVILFSFSLTSPILRISPAGGSVSPITRLDPSLVYGHFAPRFLPDGKHFLFYATGNSAGRGIYLASLDGGEAKRLTPADSDGEYVEPGYVLYVNQGTLLARRLDLRRGEMTGEPQTIADSVPTITAIGIGAFSISTNGRIAYRSGAAIQRQVVWYDRSGKRTEAAAPDVNELQSVELSPDGRRVALDRTVQSNRDVWLLDLSSARMTRFTFDDAQDGLPVWSPDSTQIVFESKRKGPYDLYLKAAGGGGVDTPLLESQYDKWPLDWSSHGDYVLYYEDNPKTAGDLLALPVKAADPKDKTPVVIANTPFEEMSGQFSPDGKWVAYQTNESGRNQIVVQSFPNPLNRSQVSNDGGTQPRWSKDGKELYFLGLDLRMMAVTVRFSGSSVDSGKPVSLFQTRIPSVPKPQYSVSADGRFLINEQVEESAATPVTLILNWKPK